MVLGLATAGCQDQLTGPTSGQTSATIGASDNSAQGAPAQVISCDVAVPDDHSSIQDAVDAATSGQTICVKPGTYSEQVSVNKAVTIQGKTPAVSGDAAAIDGWVSLNADGSELRSVVVTRSSSIDEPTIDAFAVRVRGSNTVVAHNVIHSITGESKPWGAINGIQVFGQSPIENITIRSNTVRGLRNNLKNGDTVGGVAGIKLQADLTNVSVSGNTVTGLHSAGWAWGVVLTGSGSAPNYPKNVTVTKNRLSELNDGSVQFGSSDPIYPGSSFGIDGGARADEATLSYNNLLAPNGAESKDGSNTLNAECNWWGDRSGPTDDGNVGGSGTNALERNGATIDYTPWLNAPAPATSCIGGK